jgi:hypothetical protein
MRVHECEVLVSKLQAWWSCVVDQVIGRGC